MVTKTIRKQFTTMFLSLLFLLPQFVGCSGKQSDGIAVYVSNSGNDSWSGTLAEPNNVKTDGPLASPEKARDVVREIIVKNTGKGNITVYFREGVYRIKNTLQFSKKDSGTDGVKVVWRSYMDEKVVFSGGQIISDFKPLNDKKIQSLLSSDASKNVFVASLKEQGITDFGSLKKTGFGRPIEPAPLELFFRGEPMTIARYPNDGWVKIASVPQKNGTPVDKGVERILREGIPAGRHFGSFCYDFDRPSRWSVSDDIFVHGYWSWDWAESHEKIKKINTVNREIFTEEPHGVYGYSKNQRFYFINVLEELDSPGEWYLDRKTGSIYFWPPEKPGDRDLSVSILEKPILILNEAESITIQGIIFELSRAGGIEIKNGSHNRIAGCKIRNVGNDGVIIDGGSDNGLIGCDIYNIGDTAVKLSGGDRKTLTPGGNYAINNHIHDYARINRTYRPGIHVSGVGNKVSNNVINNSPHMGILFDGNDNTLEYNEVHHVAMETGDVGAFYIGRDWSKRGNIIRYNYLHHINGPGEGSARGVYIDDCSSGTTIYGNIFYKVDKGVFIGGGRNNTIENNVFIQCNPSVHIDSRGLSWAKFWFDGRDSTLYKEIQNVNYKNPPYSVKYPEMVNITEDEPAKAKYNSVVKNISYGGRWLELYDGLNFDVVEVKNNAVSSSEPCIISDGDEGMRDRIKFYRFGQDNNKYGISDTNITIDGDPGFVSLENENFNIKDNSSVFKTGFTKIPFDKIGIYMDEYRKSK